MYHTSRKATLMILIAMIVAIIPLTVCADKPAPSTDDELRRSLDAKSGDDYDRELLGGPAVTKPASRPNEPAQRPDEASALKQRLKRELGDAAVREDEPKDPILSIARQMRKAQELIAENRAGDETQFLQRQIVSDLDKLLAQARKNCDGGSCKPCDKPQDVNPQKPVSQPKISATDKPSKKAVAQPGERPARESDPNLKTPAKEGVGERALTREVMTRIIMGLDLPPKAREQMKQLAPEEFLPKYQQQIEDYYRRLSEGKK